MNGPAAATQIAIRERLSRLEEQIAAACRRAGRARSEVALMAVSKMHPASAILEARSLGITCFGENRVQEFERKRAEMDQPGDAHHSQGIQVHLIGHLQSNKSTRAVELFSSIDTLDSVRLAERLHDTASLRQRRLPVLIEVKLSPEESKTGLDPESRELRELLERLPDLGSLALGGVMTVPPWSEDPESARPYFRRLRLLRDELAGAYPRLQFAELSMGMSQDFAVAIEEGATQIRIGTALFGARPRSQNN